MKSKFENGMPYCSIGSMGCFLLIIGSCYSYFGIGHGKVLTPPCFRLMNEKGSLDEPSVLCRQQGRQSVFIQ